MGWGVGDQEMCVFLAFTDAPDNIGGGTVDWNNAGAGVDVVWKDPQGANSPQVKARIGRLLAEAQKVKDIGGPSPTRVSRDGTIATTSLRLTALPWDVPKASGTKLLPLG